MSFMRAVLAAFVGVALAIVFLLTWRASRESGKSLPASIPLVPGEGKRVATQLGSQVVSTGSRAVQTGGRAVETATGGFKKMSEKL